MKCPLLLSGRWLVCMDGLLLGALFLTLGSPASAQEKPSEVPGLSATVSVDMDHSPDVRVIDSRGVILSIGAPAVLTAHLQVKVSGGVPPYVDAWAPPPGSRSSLANATTGTPAISASVTWGDDFTETWTVKVTDVTGTTSTAAMTFDFTCPSADKVPAVAQVVQSETLGMTTSVSIDENSTGINSRNPADISLSLGEPTVLTANLHATVNGGVPPYTYAWVRPPGSQSYIANATTGTPSISEIVNWGDSFTETWTVNVTDSTGATSSATKTFTFFSPSADNVPDAVNRVPIRGPLTNYVMTTALPVGQTHYPIVVYTPADYSATSDPLPVIYVTDGGPQNTQVIPGVIWEGWSFTDIVRYIEAQHLRFIVVGIGGNETRDIDFLLPGADTYYTFITTEIIPFVELRYHVEPTTRTLLGHSYGGAFSAYVFLKERPGTRFFFNYLSLETAADSNEYLVFQNALYKDTGGILPNVALVFSSATYGNNYWVTQYYQQLLAFNFQGLQLSRVPDFNTTHLLMFDEAFAASLQIILPKILGSMTLPTITAQPQAATVIAGSALNLQVTATGGGLGYQWNKDGIAITGANGSTYSVASASWNSNDGSYTVTVSNSKGSVVSSPAKITVTAAPVTPPPPPSSGGDSGGGGGGAFSPGFLAVLALLAYARRAGLNMSRQGDPTRE